MQDLALILHFIGLAMGLGTSFAFMFLGIKSSSMDTEERLSFQLNTLVLSKMGQIGLALLLFSGLYLMRPYWAGLPTNHLLILKLLLFLILAFLIGVISITGNKAKGGNALVHFKKIKSLGKMALLTALAIVVLAVLIFH